MRKILNTMLLVLISTASGIAQNRDEAMTKSFRKSKDNAIVMDFIYTKICGLAYDDFILYYAEAIGKNERYVAAQFIKADILKVGY